MDHHQQSRSAQRSRASLIVLIVLAFMLMAAAVVLVFSLPGDEAWQLPTATTTSPVDSMAGFLCSDGDSQVMFPFRDGIMRLGNDRVAFLDSQGSERFNAAVAMTAPMACANGSYFLAADRGGHTFSLFDASGKLFDGTTEGRICNAAISTDGYLAVVQEQTDNTGIVSLFAPITGKKLFDCYNPESGYPLSVAFTPGGNAFDVALANTSGSALRPIIKRYAFDGNQLGQRIPDLADLMPLIVYDGQGHPVLCGSTSLVALAYDQDRTVWRTDFIQVLAVKQQGQEILVLARDRQDGPCSLFSLKADGSIRFSVQIADMPDSMDIAGSLAVVGSGTHITVVDCQKGIIKMDLDLASEIIRVGYASADSVTVISRGQVRRLNVSG